MSRQAATLSTLPRRRFALGALIAVVALLVAAFWWTGYWMGVRWEATGSYYSHGWLVPPVSLYLVWRKRRQLAAARKRPCAWGWLLLAPSLLAHVFGTACQVGFISGFAMLGTLAGVVLTLLGPEVFRILLFPIAFLAFMVPLPELLIELFSFRLKMWAARIAVGTGKMFGMVLAREGSFVHMPEGRLVVDDVCSGLKYLISLTAFGALYAYISSANRWGKALLFLLAVPVAFVANVLRVTIMVAAAYVAGVETAEAWYFHDLFGFLLFIVAFVILFAVEALLLKPRKHGEDDTRTGRSDNGATPEPLSGRLRVSPAAYGAVLLPLAAVAAVSVHLSWPRQTASASQILSVIPEQFGRWHGRDQELDDRTYDVLGTRDVLSRFYVDDRGRRVQLLIVVAQQIRRRTHPPEQCFSGGGYSIRSRTLRTVPVALQGQSSIEVRELALDGPGHNRLAWYFYKTGRRISTSYFWHQAGVALRKIAAPDAADILIRVDALHQGPPGEQERQRLTEFLNALSSSLERLP